MFRHLPFCFFASVGGSLNNGLLAVLILLSSFAFWWRSFPLVSARVVGGVPVL
jgi:cytochrome c oxidase assembly factor CtaG